jgi:flavoprotein hydroxylase
VDPELVAKSGTDSDVVVVGFGPVGATLAVLLAQRGWRVTALDSWPQPYDQPRATSFDGHAARLLADAGIAAALERIGEPANGYDWVNAAGQTLLHIPLRTVGRYGWPDATTVHQPTLEAALAERAAALPGLTVLRGHTVTGIEDDGAGVRVTAERTTGGSVVHAAQWVVGCDGANSFVRGWAGLPEADLGFSYDWMLCDVTFRVPRTFTPTNVQLCDPRRPATMVGSGPGRRRFEFMRLPGESVESLGRPGTAWRLLSRFDVTPSTAKLLRQRTYTFRSKWVTRWREGRALVAGDAAHQMPPFAGQGMCAGLQDAANLAWRLDRVLAGTSGEAVLDGYGEERAAQAERTIRASVALGKVICVSDEDAAQDRDRAMLARAARANGPEPAGALAGGLVHRSGGGVSPGAGAVLPQGRVTFQGRTGLLEEVLRSPGGPAFTLLTTGSSAAWASTRLDELGVRTWRLARPAGAPADAVADLDEVVLSYLDAAGAGAALVRPDHHVFGLARSPDDLPELAEQLQTGLDRPVTQSGNL